MRDDAEHLDHRRRWGRRRRWCRLRRPGPLAAALLAVGLFLSGCSGGSAGPGVAGGGGSTTPSPSSSTDPRAAALAYSECMRAHGISDFPDPDAKGGFAIQVEPGSDLDPNNPRYQAADKACKSLLPAPPSEQQQKQELADMLKYARCMREHGFPDFPDPKPNGGIDIDAGQHPDLNPDNPRFQAANKACGGPGPGNTNTQTSGGTP